MVVYVLSMLFPAISAIFKEKIFAEAKEKLNGRTLDLFAVNSFGSAAQALFVLLLLPVLASLRDIPVAELPNYLREGAHNLQSLPTSSLLGTPIKEYPSLKSNLFWQYRSMHLDTVCRSPRTKIHCTAHRLGIFFLTFKSNPLHLIRNTSKCESAFANLHCLLDLSIMSFSRDFQSRPGLFRDLKFAQCAASDLMSCSSRATRPGCMLSCTLFR